MYPSTNRHQLSFEAVQNPSGSAVVGTVLAAAAVPLAVVAVLSYPAIGLAGAAFVVVAYRLLTTGRARRPYRRRLVDFVGRSHRSPAGGPGDSSRTEETA